MDYLGLRDLFSGHPAYLAPALLGAHLRVVTGGELVAVRLTEVEAYGDQGEDPGAHSYRGQTPRNRSLFGPPLHTYVYLNYGIHRCLNLTCGPPGTAGGVLLRAGEVVAGHAPAIRRRGRDTGRKLLSGPGRLGQGLAITLPMDGREVLLRSPAQEDDDADAGQADTFVLSPAEQQLAEIRSGPRVGVSGVGGGREFPWRFWLAGEPSVSAYRPGR